MVSVEMFVVVTASTEAATQRVVEAMLRIEKCSPLTRTMPLARGRKHESAEMR